MLCGEEMSKVAPDLQKINKEELLRTAKMLYFKNSYYLEKPYTYDAWRMAIKLAYMICFKVQKFSNYFALATLNGLIGKKLVLPAYYLVNDYYLEAELDRLIDFEFEKKFINRLMIENE
jgi:hypothetical protein